jgi:hypothetical protein
VLAGLFIRADLKKLYGFVQRVSITLKKNLIQIYLGKIRDPPQFVLSALLPIWGVYNSNFNFSIRRGRPSRITGDNKFNG